MVEANLVVDEEWINETEKKIAAKKVTLENLDFVLRTD